MVSLQAQKEVAKMLKEKHSFSERKACRLINIARSSHRYKRKERDANLKERIKILCIKKTAYGYRRIHALLRREGDLINHKRTYRLYKEGNFSLRKKQKKKCSSQCKKPLEMPIKVNQRWGMDFMSDNLANGRSIRSLNILDLYTRECLEIKVDRSLNSIKVINLLEELEKTRGLPEAITLDNGPEYTAKAVQKWAEEKGVYLDYIPPGEPTKNGFVESFNGKFREECLNQNIFFNLFHAKAIIENWRCEYNQERPHSALDYLTPQEYALSKRAC